MRALTLDADGPVHVADHGGDGPPMVLVHGLGGSHVNWGAVAPRFAETHHVFAPDLPGFGLTELGDRRTTVAANIAVLERLLEQLAPDGGVVIGNSMGGLLALGAAAERPERFRALVLTDPALPAPPDHPLRIDAVARSFLLAYLFPWAGTRRLRRVAQRQGPESLVRQTLALCAADVDSLDAELVAAHVELQRQQSDTLGWDAAFFSTARSLVNVLALRRRVVAWIQRVSVPTLLIHGSRDRLISVRSARAAAVMRPDWEYCELAGVGHIPMMEAPEVFVDLTNGWLQRAMGSTRR
ncbi:MAG: alpha/beta hydrolase [Candidatus Dormibacteraeota bacterium]|nr:alpha/beta hydrolase [Candidatus Dormibacteraeota bacterium]